MITVSRRILELEDGLRKLRNEVEAIKAFEIEVRQAIGNTNWTCLFARVAIADSLLGNTLETPAEPQMMRACSICHGHHMESDICPETKVELHTCPYKVEINDDRETLCDCSPEKTQDCADDI